VIGQRIGRLPPESRELLSTASILGREFAIRELGAITKCEEEVVLERLEDAITARVLVEAPDIGRLRFSHALVRDTLYEGLGAAHRRTVHLRTGEILERVYLSEPDSHLAELAHHFFRALPSGDPSKAVEYARRAGDRTIALLAYEEAARLYSLALRALGQHGAEIGARRCSLLVALGDASARAGDEPAAKEAFLEAASIAEEAGLFILQAQAALGYGGRLVWSRAYNDVHLIPLLEAALRALPADASSLRVRVMARLSGALRDHLSRDRRSSLSAQAVQIARDLDDPASLAYALDGHYCAILGPDTLVERAALANEIVELAQQVGDSERLAAGRLYRAIANMELGRLASVQAELETMAGEAAELRQPAQLWVATVSRANLALFRGRFADAQSLVHEALTLGQRAQRRDAVLSHRLQLFVLDREVGGNPEIEALITQSVSEFPMRPVFRCALAYIHARNLDASRARAAIDELAQSDFGAIQRDNEYLFSLGFAADAVCAQGDLSAAAVLYDLMAPFAEVNAANADEISTGSVSRPLGVLAAAMSRWNDASHHFVAAIEHNREMGARPWLAHSYHDYARMLLARGGAGDEETAAEFLATARGEYEALGMEPWAAQISRARTTA
jgi:hypothetical protein